MGGQRIPAVIPMLFVYLAIITQSLVVIHGFIVGQKQLWKFIYFLFFFFSPEVWNVILNATLIIRSMKCYKLDR